MAGNAGTGHLTQEEQGGEQGEGSPLYPHPTLAGGRELTWLSEPAGAGMQLEGQWLEIRKDFSGRRDSP